jgi:magnesium chelatase subunit D
MTRQKSYLYPFTALVGQEKLKRALLLNAVNQRLGGILVRGEKGTAKSTAVRALAALLPEIEVVKGCPYSCDPGKEESLCPFCREQLKGGQLQRTFRPVRMVELPVSATEDRLVGSLDFEYAIKYGRPRFEPGLLARAHRGIIYVDEVNLLDDHLVDSLLDAAAMGMNVVEREGISYTHPAEFILVGTMNPEEGELRPQLLDRFGFCVQVEGVLEPAERVEIIKRREDFDRNPVGFIEHWVEKELSLRRRIAETRKRLPSVQISREMLELASRLSAEAGVAGHRADLYMVRGSMTLAAWEGRSKILERDVYAAAELVLPHRARDISFPPPQEPQEGGGEEEENPPQEEQQVEEESDGERQENKQEDAAEGEEHEGSRQSEKLPGDLEGGEEKRETSLPSSPEEMVFTIGAPFAVKSIGDQRDRILRTGSGRRSRTKTASRAGRYIRSTMERKNNDLALDATLRAASPYQLSRKRLGVAVAIETQDIREKVREKRIGRFLLFTVDASGSMGARERMVETKGAIFSLLLDAYQKRDRIGMVAFRGQKADLLLPPTSSVERAEKLLAELPTGGKTPLSAGLARAYEVAMNHLHKDPHISPLLIIISDGKANVSMGKEKPLVELRRVAEFIAREERIKTLVVDVEEGGFLSFGLAGELARLLGGEYYKIDDLKADTLVQAVRMYL